MIISNTQVVRHFYIYRNNITKHSLKNLKKKKKEKKKSSDHFTINFSQIVLKSLTNKFLCFYHDNIRKKKPLTKQERLIKRFLEHVENSLDNTKDEIMSIFYKTSFGKK